MAALVRAYNRDPDAGTGTPEISVLLDGADLRTVTRLFTVACRELMVLLAAGSGEPGRDPVAHVDERLEETLAAWLGEEAEGDGG
jgi:hypothetical protein